MSERHVAPHAPLKKFFTEKQVLVILFNSFVYYTFVFLFFLYFSEVSKYNPHLICHQRKRRKLFWCHFTSHCAEGHRVIVFINCALWLSPKNICRDRDREQKKEKKTPTDIRSCWGGGVRAQSVFRRVTIRIEQPWLEFMGHPNMNACTHAQAHSCSQLGIECVPARRMWLDVTFSPRLVTPAPQKQPGTILYPPPCKPSDPCS